MEYGTILIHILQATCIQYGTFYRIINLFIRGQRLGLGNRPFILDLASLKAVDETSKNYKLLDDYSVWFVKYRKL
jgi:hypothetical protein